MKCDFESRGDVWKKEPRSVGGVSGELSGQVIVFYHCLYNRVSKTVWTPRKVSETQCDNVLIIPDLLLMSNFTNSDVF